MGVWRAGQEEQKDGGSLGQPHNGLEDPELPVLKYKKNMYKLM